MLAFMSYKPNEFKEFSKDECDKRRYKYIFGEDEEDVDVNESSEESTDNHGEIFDLKEQTEVPLRNLYYGDLCVRGLIWLKNLKTVLIGATFRIIPVVKAAKAHEPPPPPERPPLMKYKELPIYESPHYDYNEHVNSKKSCPGANTKLLQRSMLPNVKKCRENAQGHIHDVSTKANSIYGDAVNSIDHAKKDVKEYMRDPKNLTLRQAVVGGGIAAGFIKGSTIPRRLLYAGLGGLATGSLCFPDETDKFFRNFMSNCAKTVTGVYNMYCGKSYRMKEKIPCTSELPEEPPKRTSSCPPPPPPPPPKKKPKKPKTQKTQKTQKPQKTQKTRKTEITEKTEVRERTQNMQNEQNEQ